MKIEQIPTPALIVDKDIFDKNIEKMCELTKTLNIASRPHYKSNKCALIAKLQVEKGAKGLTCAKLSEAEDLVYNGIKDILIANEITEQSKILKMAELSKMATLTICIDDKKNADNIEKALALVDSKMFCYVEFDTGMNRCGVLNKEDALSLAQHIVKNCSHLTFNGLQAYAGDLSHESNTKKRKEEVKTVIDKVKEVKDYLENNGIKVKEVSGVSTGTIIDKAPYGLYTEAQTGSYIFLDGAYNKLNIPFENSLFVLTTVISVKEDRFITDSGVKTCGVDQGMPELYNYKGEYSIALHEEHGLISAKNHNFNVGDKVKYIPGHCCSTVNLYDKIYFVKNDEVDMVVPITSRGKSQ